MSLLLIKDEQFSPQADVPFALVALGTNILFPLLAVRMPRFLSTDHSVHLCHVLLWLWCIFQIGMLLYLSWGTYGQENAAGDTYFDVGHTFLAYFGNVTLIANAFFFVGLSHAFSPIPQNLRD
jgi:hypothetical protein